MKPANSEKKQRGVLQNKSKDGNYQGVWEQWTEKCGKRTPGKRGDKQTTKSKQRCFGNWKKKNRSKKPEIHIKAKKDHDRKQQVQMGGLRGGGFFPTKKKKKKTHGTK